MRLIAWNTAGRVAKHPNQVEWLCQQEPDVIALQEVTARTLDLWRDAQTKMSHYNYFADSWSLAPDRSILAGPRRYGQVFISRYPLETQDPGQFPLPWPERVLSVNIDSPAGPIEAHTTHIPPGSSNGWTKIEMLEGIANRLGQPHQGHRLLCGDFNMPQEEPPGQDVVYWDMARRKDGSYRRSRKPRWGLGEAGVHEGLAEHDLGDVCRRLRTPGDEDFSWIPRHGKSTARRRFDHVYASASLPVSAVTYKHEARTSGLSDHSALCVDFDL